jgi:hypothetical protein
MPGTATNKYLLLAARSGEIWADVKANIVARSSETRIDVFDLIMQPEKSQLNYFIYELV